MTDPPDELHLKDFPSPPLFKLVSADGRNALQNTEVAGEPASVTALFSNAELAAEFAHEALEFGMPELVGRRPQTLPDWSSVESHAAGGADYVLVVTETGTGLFHADDVARHSSERALEQAGEMPFPLYLFADERGESPLISVEDAGGEILVAALFTNPERAHTFRERASHLDLPASLGTIEDRDGLGRHARVAQQAGAAYAVLDPESGLSEAIPLEELAP